MSAPLLQGGCIRESGNLVAVDARPAVIPNYMFHGSGLRSFYSDATTDVGEEAFATWINDSFSPINANLRSVWLPNAKTVGDRAFQLQKNMVWADVPSVSSLG